MSSNSNGSSQIGIDIVLAGLSFQVFTLTIFVILASDYAIKYLRHRSNVRSTTTFKVFASFLALAIILILTRCVYRIVELRQGYRGKKAKLIRNQGLFIGLEGV
jgi:tellurite resistance protein TehA-like permease